MFVGGERQIEAIVGRLILLLMVVLVLGNELYGLL